MYNLKESINCYLMVKHGSREAFIYLYYAVVMIDKPISISLLSCHTDSYILFLNRIINHFYCVICLRFKWNYWSNHSNNFRRNTVISDVSSPVFQSSLISSLLVNHFYFSAVLSLLLYRFNIVVF